MRAQTVIRAVLPSFLRVYADRIEASPLGYRLARGAFWSVAGAIISRGLGIVASIVVARVLGKAGFGELGIIYSTIMMFQVFAGLSMGSTATKYVAEFRSTNPEKARRILGMAWVVSVVAGAIFAALFFLLAPWLASHTLAAPHLAGPLQIASAIVFISAVNGAQCGVLAGLESFKAIAGVNLVVGILNLPLMVAGVLWAGLDGAVWALVVCQAASWVLYHWAIGREARRFGLTLDLVGCLQELPVLWKFSLPAVLAGVMVVPVNWVCNALLVNRENGYAEMGVLNAANQWYNALLFVPGILAAPILPVLSERFGAGAKQQSQKVLLLAMAGNAAIVLPFAVVGSLASPLIMELYGESFVGGWPVLAVALATAALLSVQFPVGQLITASGRMWIGFLTNLLWAGVILVTTLILVRFGAMGVAWARLVAYACHAIWTLGAAYIILGGLRGSKDAANAQSCVQ